MTVRAAGEHGYQLTRMALFNAYLVKETDGWTVIDTTLPGAANSILTAAGEQGSSKIERIVLTHAHSDHIGSVDALATASGAVNLAISTRDARLLLKPPAQDRSLDPGEPQCKVKGGFPGVGTRPTHLLSDGELFGSLRCIATPGHTPGHVCFLDERDGTLYAGDALVAVGGTLHVAGFGPWYFPAPRLATWHRPTALASAQRLLTVAGSAIRRYAAGHGRLVEGGPELLQASITQAQRALK